MKVFSWFFVTFHRGGSRWWSCASAFYRKLNFRTPSCRSLWSGSLSIPSHADITSSLYLLTSAPRRHAAGQEPGPRSANELVCCVFVCTQLGGCGCGNQVQEGRWWRVYNAIDEEVEGTYPELWAVFAQVFLHSVSVLKLETVFLIWFFCKAEIKGIIMVYYRLAVELIALSIIQNIEPTSQTHISSNNTRGMTAGTGGGIWTNLLCKLWWMFTRGVLLITLLLDCFVCLSVPILQHRLCAALTLHVQIKQI